VILSIATASANATDMSVAGIVLGEKIEMQKCAGVGSAGLVF
jgi:hypothetical protein